MPAQSFEASVLVASPQAADIFLLTVYLLPQCEKPKAGQLYMLRAWAADEPPLLSRPISVHHYEEGTRAELSISGEGPGHTQAGGPAAGRHAEAHRPRGQRLCSGG